MRQISYFCLISTHHMKKTFFLLFTLLSCHILLAQDTTLKTDHSLSRDTVGVFQKVEVEANFPGGDTAWRQFLIRNLNVDAAGKDVPAKKNYFKQTALCRFIVCADGTICDIRVTNNVIPSIKTEVERLIATSGKWTPAQVNGKKVKAYKVQPVTLIYEME